jgi:hypothetical protein
MRVKTLFELKCPLVCDSDTPLIIELSINLTVNQPEFGRELVVLHTNNFTFGKFSVHVRNQ